MDRYLVPRGAGGAQDARGRGELRVGRVVYVDGRKVLPRYPGFSLVEVMTASTKYGSLGPYVLRDEEGRLMENLWQFSKVYARVPATRQRRSRFDRTVIWERGAETHVRGGELTEAYWKWRADGMAAPDPIRYPVGFATRSACLYALHPDAGPDDDAPRLSYVEARSEIYIPIYKRLVRRAPQYAELLRRLRGGENLLIAEVDGPHEESNAHYEATYGVAPVERGTILASPATLDVLRRDTRHPYGHGYCLAEALLEDVD